MFIVSIIVSFQSITFKLTALNCSLFNQTAGTLVLQCLTIPSNTSNSPSISASSVTIIRSSSSSSLSVLRYLWIHVYQLLIGEWICNLCSSLLFLFIHSLFRFLLHQMHLSLFSLWSCDLHHAYTNTFQPSAPLSLVE